ncbi:hypothetical protein RIR_jg18549.t1 [Rhizophagus irregularis DAOM 181602=DAOM 197198]|nr:hypothetical protein RIR_jg18549.t1 [Rhizophagus irregularis DAOM 181602=DAOM 197198]
MAVNIPLSLNSYKPKRWAYINFKSQQMMNTAMEQSIALQGHRLQWELPENTNKLCHRCGKLGCAPTACPLNNSRGRLCIRNPVAHLKKRFNIGQSNNHNSSANRSRHRSRSQSKDRSNSRQRNRSASSTGSFKMDQISSFFSRNHISFGGIVDTHLSPKQMKFLSKRVCDYTSFHSDLDSTKHGHSSGGVSLIIKAANSALPSVTVDNTYVPKKPKDLESLCQSYRFLSNVAKTIRSLHKTPTSYSIHHETKWSSYYIRLNNLLSLYKQTFVTPIILPPLLRDARIDDFVNLLQIIENMTLLLRSLLLLKEKNSKLPLFRQRLMLGMITLPMIFPLLLSLLCHEPDDE